MKQDKSIYISVDVEADGLIPGPSSMLSLGAAAYRLADGGYTLAGTFSMNLETLPGAAGHPTTMKWWETQPAAWKACRTDLQDPAKGMVAFADWVKTFPEKPVFVAFPAGFDFTWVYWYLMRFVGESPFSFSALDVKTFASVLLGLPYRDAVKKNFPSRWFGDGVHNHVALSDALEQGEMFMKMLLESIARPVGR